MAQSGESLEFTLPCFIWIWVCRPLVFSVHQGKKHRTFCTADLQPRWLELTGTKGEEWFRTTLRSLWTSRLQEDFSTTAGCCHHPFQPLHCQDAKKIRRDFFFLIARTILFWTYLAHGNRGYYGVMATFSFPAPAVRWRWEVGLPSCLLLEPSKARQHLD